MRKESRLTFQIGSLSFRSQSMFTGCFEFLLRVFGAGIPRFVRQCGQGESKSGRKIVDGGIKRRTRNKNKLSSQPPF
jgi:hypothetical protein